MAASKVRRQTDIFDEEIMSRIVALTEGEHERSKLLEDHHLETISSACPETPHGTDLAHLNEDLLEAAEAGQRLEVASLIGSGADPNFVDAEGYTPLIYATCRGQVSVMKELIYRGAHVNFQADDGTTCVHVAAQNLDEPALQCLLSESADANIKHGKSGETPLSLAAQTGNAKIVQLLIDGGAKVDKQHSADAARSVYICAQENYVEVMRILTAAGAPFDRVHKETGLTPLQTAVEHHRTLVARHLMGLGADVRKPFDDGTTILMLCICNGDLDLVDAILHVKRAKKGPFHLDIQDREGFTAAHVAAEEGNWQVLKFIMTAGADMTLKNKNGETPADVIEAEHGTFPDDVVPGILEACGANDVLADADMPDPSLDEHKVMAILHQSSMVDTKVHMVFKNVDLNGDGWLTEDELQSALEDLGFKEMNGEFGQLVHEKFAMLKSDTHKDRIDFQDFEMIYNQAQEDYERIRAKEEFKRARAAAATTGSEATLTKEKIWAMKKAKSKGRYRSVGHKHVNHDLSIKKHDSSIAEHVKEVAPKVRKLWSTTGGQKDVMALGFYTFKRACETTQRRIEDAVRTCGKDQAKIQMCSMYKDFFKTQLQGLTKGVLDRGRAIFKALNLKVDQAISFESFSKQAAPMILEDFKGHQNDLNGQQVTLPDITKDFKALDVDNTNTISFEELREYLLIVQVMLLSSVIYKALDAITAG